MGGGGVVEKPAVGALRSEPQVARVAVDLFKSGELLSF